MADRWARHAPEISDRRSYDAGEILVRHLDGLTVRPRVEDDLLGHRQISIDENGLPVQRSQWRHGARFTVLGLFGRLHVDVAIRAIDTRAAARGALHAVGCRFGHRAHDLERLLTIAAHEFVDGHVNTSAIVYSRP